MEQAPVVCPGAKSRPAPSGFSLVELLVLIAILATLVLIGFGIFQGVRQQASAAHARSDLATLSQGLEQYRRHFGAYPETADSPDKLYRALTGRLSPAGKPVNVRNLLAPVPVNLNDDAQPDAAGNYFVDPWGHAYQYVFFTRQEGTASLQRSYVLFSFGQRSTTAILPTRAQVVPSTSGPRGGAVSTDPINAPNIYAGP